MIVEVTFIMKTLLTLLLFFIFLTFLSCKKDTANNCIKGAVNPNCNCPLLINYVCGCNNQTYDNSCYAQFDGITNYTMGRCP